MFLTRVKVENFRSIASCDVRLGPLTVLVGPNAAGKSNFLDAVRFVRDALDSSPGQALETRGGLAEVLHHEGAGQPELFRIELSVSVPASRAATFDAVYVLEVGRRPGSEDFVPVLRREELFVDGQMAPGEHFIPEMAGEGPVFWRDDMLLRAPRDNPEAKVLSRDLRNMRFYELLTPVLRDVDRTSGGRNRPLGENGERLARVLAALGRERPSVKDTIDGYLSTMIDNAVGLDGVETRELDVAGVVGRFLGDDGRVAEVDFRSLSEGTLRLAGVLAALFQPRALNGEIPLIGIEEPEISLHPPMVGALYDALIAAAHNTQVVVTSQSADLLDNAAADPSHLLVARNDGSGTVIGPIDAAGRRLLDNGVLSLPELLRSGELRPGGAMPPTQGTPAEGIEQ